MAIWVYHFTHISNLPAIIRSGGLCSNTKMRQDGCAPVTDIGNANIKDRRENIAVPVPPFGVVADYIPFYFAPRSPMLFTIKEGNIPAYHGQDELIYFVANAHRIASSHSCCFTNGNAAHALSRFFSDLTPDDPRLDWEVIRAKFWRNTPDDSDRRRRRQAEFLVYAFIPLTLFCGVATRTPELAEQVRLSIPDDLRVAAKPDWYYD